MILDRASLKDLAFEIGFAGATCLLAVSMFGFAILAFIFPFHNYHHAKGVVEYDKEVPLSMERGGVLYKVLVEPNERVAAGQPILELLNEGRREEVSSLDFKLDMKRQEIDRARRLYQLGALELAMVRQKEAEQQDLLFQRKMLKTNVVKAPYDGWVYFTSSPQMLVGSYLAEGQIVAFLYQQPVKGVRIVESSLLVDRLHELAPIKVYFQDSGSRHPHISGKVDEIVLDRARNSLSLYCSISTSRQFFDSLPAGSSLNVAILIGSKSLFESFFDFDAYGYLKSVLGPRPFRTLERWLD